jgi:hypothetical protein
LLARKRVVVLPIAFELFQKRTRLNSHSAAHRELFFIRRQVNSRFVCEALG